MLAYSPWMEIGKESKVDGGTGYSLVTEKVFDCNPPTGGASY
jgi:hypothetical protein